MNVIIPGLAREDRKGCPVQVGRGPAAPGKGDGLPLAVMAVK